MEAVNYPDTPSSVFYDVVIIGGGPAGCAVAVQLLRHGCTVAIIDKGSNSRFSIGETLVPEVSGVLQTVGLQNALIDCRRLPARGVISSWGSSDPEVRDFLFSPHGNGWHIDRAQFNALLLREAKRAGVDVVRNQVCRRGAASKSGWTVTLSYGSVHPLNCTVLIDASGRESSRATDLPAKKPLDCLIAATFTVVPKIGIPVSDYTVIEAVDEGWFYSALVPNNLYVVAYMTDGDLYANGKRHEHCFVNRQLAKARTTRERVDFGLKTEKLFSAKSAVRPLVATSNCLAIGDSALSCDPLSGRGVWAALKEADQSTPLVMQLLAGDCSGLAAYNLRHLARFNNYQMARHSYYNLEHRWSESSFWKKRQKSFQLVHSSTDDSYFLA